MDNNEYYKKLKEAMDDPECHGIINIKGRGRRSKYDDLCFYCHYHAKTLQSGGTVFVACMEEDQKYIDTIVWYLTNIYLLEVTVDKRYNDGGIYDSNPKRFIGYSIKIISKQ